MYITVYLQNDDRIGKYIRSLPAHSRSLIFCSKLEQYLSGGPLEWPESNPPSFAPKSLRVYISINPQLFPKLMQYVNYLLEQGARNPSASIRDLAYGMKLIGWEGAVLSVDRVNQYVNTPKRRGRPLTKKKEAWMHLEPSTEPLQHLTAGEFTDAKEILRRAEMHSL